MPYSVAGRLRPAFEMEAEMNDMVMQRVRGLPEALVRGVRQRRDRRAAVAALRRMNDHMLRDIGLSRGDITRSVRSGR